MGKFIIIREARCSFPQLYGPGTMPDGSQVKPGITLVLEQDKHASAIAEIEAEKDRIIAENPALKKNPPSGERLCLREPNREELKYKPGNQILKANSNKPPLVLHPDGKTEMTEATDKIYSGCYVNAKVELWGQSNQYGRRVNAKIVAVQFVPIDADSFDGSYVSPEEAMEGFGSLQDDSADAFLGDAPATVTGNPLLD